EIPRKNGKDLDLDTPILTMGGWKTMGTVEVGDAVYGPDGAPTRIIANSKTFTGHECFEVSFSDGQRIIAGADHEWTVYDRLRAGNLERPRTGPYARHPGGGERRTLTTAQLARSYLTGSREDRRYSLLPPAPIERPEAELLVPPYLLGAWLGDGVSSSAALCGIDREIFEEFEAAGYAIRWRRSGSTHGIGGGLQVQLRELGVLGHKHVPDAYLLGSEKQRLALLQGLMDTDGHADKHGRVEFCNTRRELADAVLFLARSLGHKAKLHEKRAMLDGRDCGPKYLVTWTACREETPFRLERKTERLRPRLAHRTRAGTIQIVGVRAVATRPTRCIQVARDDGLYLAGHGLIPTHNSSLVSRLLIVHFTADGQMGGEVYALATSTEQARQVFGEGQTVVRRSPALRGRVEVLTSVMRVPRSGSIFRVLSRIAEAVHGLNPSAAGVDEVHLHKNRALIDAIETGTAARSEPIVYYITTSGNDDETTIYAEKHGYAIQLAEGKATNTAIWVVIWCADPADDPFAEETWAAANPNYPISPTREYLVEKSEKAKVRPSFLPTFKRLHLNIRGTQAAQAWPGAEAWPNGAGMVPLDKLKAKPVWLGLCAASSSDLSAIAIVARNPEGPGWWARWRWFCPEETLSDLNRRTEGHAQTWVGTWLELTEGNVIDVARHAEVIRELAKTYDLREMGYDPNGAVGIISPLVDELGDRLVPLYASNPSSALLEWERLLKSGTGKDAEFAHGGDPIAAWQVSHLRVKESATKITRIDRRASTENVSGIAACEMALRRATIATEPKRWDYDAEGLIIV
ncbi:MAG: terminase large subunit, partial [Actinomycetota bacterium]|nr:terminase large subunit [Actinomycetota bacterium]